MNRTFAAGLSLMLVWVGAAHGQDAPPAPSSGEKRPPLQGPTVKQNRPPHQTDDFTDGMKGGKDGRYGLMIPMRSYAEIIDKLRGDHAPEALRLSEKQEHDIGAIEQEFREASKEFAQKMRQERASQGQPKPDQPKGEPGDKADRPRRELMQEMGKNGPKPGDYQTRIWAALNEKQQTFVKGELDTVREELQKKRGEEAMARRIEQRKGEKDAAPGQPQVRRPADGANTDATPIRERAQKLIRRLAQLPAEDRDRIMKRLEEELDRRGIPDAPPKD